MAKITYTPAVEGIHSPNGLGSENTASQNCIPTGDVYGTKGMAGGGGSLIGEPIASDESGAGKLRAPTSDPKRGFFYCGKNRGRTWHWICEAQQLRDRIRGRFGLDAVH
jgi:hypothetical protein